MAIPGIVWESKNELEAYFKYNKKSQEKDLVISRTVLRPLTVEEEREVLDRIEEGCDIAPSLIVRCNISFVIDTCIKKYPHIGDELRSDLIMEGITGLYESVGRFDRSRGLHFISYAVWWVRQRMRKYFDANIHSIQYANSVRKNVTKLANAHKKMEGELRRCGSDVEALAFAGEDMTDDQLFQARKMSRHMDLSIYNPRHFGDTNHRPLTWANDVLRDDYSESRVYEVYKRQDYDAIEAAMNIIPEREAYIISKYYGLGEDGDCTLAEVGETLGITRERVRQLRDRGLKLMRESDLCDQLHEAWMDI